MIQPPRPLARLRTWCALFALTSLASCSSLRFEEFEVLETSYDPASRGTRMAVRFEVWEGDLPVQGLGEDDIVVYEDGVRATSESFDAARPETIRLPITLLIDTSRSMYTGGAIGPIKRAAQEFVDDLRSSGYDVRIFRFATDVARLGDVSEIPDGLDQLPEGQRWTSLYAAVQQALALGPEDIVVVFSDGADNYSQNHGVSGLDEVLDSIDSGDRQVHTIGFGEVRREYDRDGVRGLTALRRLGRNGTYQFAEDEESFRSVFEYIADRMRSVYTYEYVSPNLEGTHELVVEARHGRKKGRSKAISVDLGELED